MTVIAIEMSHEYSCWQNKYLVSVKTQILELDTHYIVRAALKCRLPEISDALTNGKKPTFKMKFAMTELSEC